MVIISFNCNNLNKTNEIRSLLTEQDRKEFVIRRLIKKSVLLQSLEGVVHSSISMSSSSSGSTMLASLASSMSESVMTWKAFPWF